jgi:group II intron reverse transcriptase/maturase
MTCDRKQYGIGDCVKLVTPGSIQKLQTALYERAKREPKLRFYSVYDKVYRQEMLEHAYALSRANRGAAGPDGVTFEDIETSGGPGAMLARLAKELKTKEYEPGPVRRVYIPKANGGERPLGIPNICDRVVAMAVKLVLEPIFEADFDVDSYGFRPGRDAHQALAAIRESVAAGMAWVVDADVSRCFDTIPHDKLMRTVASRVVDGSMLALIKKFLKAPVLDERDGGRRTRPRAGTPQGGPVSPLLANIYLHLLDRNFRAHVERGALQGRLVRYADDLLILCDRPPARERQWLGRLIERLGLTLHPDKTRVVHVGDEWVNFLGYRVRRRANGRVALDISQKAMSRIRDTLREQTHRTFLPLEELISELNLYIRGAGEYFRLAEPRTLWNLDRFVLARIARWGRHKRVRRLPEWSLARGTTLYREHGLVTWWRRKQSARTPAWARS